MLLSWGTGGGESVCAVLSSAIAGEQPMPAAPEDLPQGLLDGCHSHTLPSGLPAGQLGHRLHIVVITLRSYADHARLAPRSVSAWQQELIITAAAYLRMASAHFVIDMTS